MTAAGPNRHLAAAQYRRHAPGYDLRTRALARYRQQAVARLYPSSGSTVLDVACGTGSNFELLQRYIGPTGRLIGIDLSPDMLTQARRRVRHAGWRNVTLIESSLEEASLSERADAALFRSPTTSCSRGGR